MHSPGEGVKGMAIFVEEWRNGCRGENQERIERGGSGERTKKTQ